MNIARQGDVLLRRVTKKPANLKATNSPVLVSGEATGHAHRVADLSNTKVFVDEAGAVCFLENTQEVTIDHEEHGPITLPPGKWDVILQREYSPEENRRVID